ncbi:ATP-binding protein [Actinomyces sp.]|uniref:ATP-binding protein n=1 Tax=Actinomyces sp. TaxID=29317 RepID=UPI0026DB9524|nr:ATP-binding protein [Actinomyces sp.]MDO4899181.1 ATP-binding protein [Actinomyces sp.]
MNVGRITRVDGVRVSAAFYERMQPFLVEAGKPIASPRINSFVKTGVGLDTVICQIVGEHEAEFDKKSEITRVEQSAPTGAFAVDLEVRGHISNGEFKGGLRCLPIVGATIETLDGEELAMLYSTHGATTMCIGKSLFDETNSVFLDAGKLMASHIGVFGNTGSGKSNTLASILHKYTELIPKRSSSARIIIFDLNNEYGGDAIVPIREKAVYHLDTRRKVNVGRDRIPLDLSELDEDSWGTILRATQKTQMPVVRRAFRRWKNEAIEQFIIELRKSIADRRTTLFYTLRNYCADELSGIDELAYHTKNNCFYYATGLRAGKSHAFVDTEADLEEIAFRSKPSRLYEFYFWLVLEASRAAESGMNFEFVQPLLPRAKGVVGDLEKLFDNSEHASIASILNDNVMAVVQLGDVNAGSREMLPSLLAELVMKDAAENKGDGTPTIVTTLVVDEAHNLLGYDAEQSDLVHDNTLRVFERIIKEGRKYGVFLGLASQRPSDISPTITSQIHNYFIHKLVNPNDIGRIRKTVSFMGESSLSMLTALGQGECIVSGPSLYMPQYVYIEQLEKDNQPNSSDMQLFGAGGILQEDDFSLLED